MRGNTTAAKEILAKFKMDERDVQSDLQLWTSAHYKMSYLSVFKEHFGIIHAIPVFGLYMFEQLIGAVPILFYLQKVFGLTGKNGMLYIYANYALVSNDTDSFLLKYNLSFPLNLDGDFSPEMSTIICGTIFAIGTLMPRYFVNREGLMWSTNLMAAILGVLGLYCHFVGSFDPNTTKDYRYIPLICLALVYILFATGPHRLANEYAEQVIPKKCYFTIRCMLATTSWLLIYVITRMLPQLIRNVGVGWLFWFMATMCVLMSVFVRLFVIDVSQMPEESRLVDNSSSSSSNSESNSSESNSEA